MPSRRATYFTILAVLGVIGGLFALWWWALFGLSIEIGTAAGVTAGVMMFVGSLGSVE